MSMSEENPDNQKDAVSKNDFIKGRTQTQVLINSANVIDAADAQVLSALYEPIQTSLNFDLTQLGAITAARALTQAISTPVWGWFSDKFSRKNVLAIGCLLWGAFTVVLAFLKVFWGLLFVRALTGLGLAVIFPTAQSLISDYFHESKRGKAFGFLGLTGVLGAIVGTLYATALGGITILGLEGWRFVFITLGGFSLLLGVFVWLFGKDPIRGISEDEVGELVDKKTEEKYTIKAADYRKILTNKTFLLIVLQGVAGSIPWNAIFWVVYWFEHIGFSDVLSGIAFSVIAIGAALGNLFGGFLGDKAAKWDPNKGRIMVAQISVFSGIPMMFVIFMAIPQVDTTVSLILFILIGIITGFMISWCAPAANNPIFSELFEPEIRSTAFSIDRLFEGSVAASGTLIVASLAEKAFGFVSPGEEQTIEDLPQAVIDSNIKAMSYAILITTCVPWLFCLIVYSFIYFTYPKDRERCKESLLERQMELLEERKKLPSETEDSKEPSQPPEQDQESSTIEEKPKNADSLTNNDDPGGA